MEDQEAEKEKGLIDMEKLSEEDKVQLLQGLGRLRLDVMNEMREAEGEDEEADLDEYEKELEAITKIEDKLTGVTGQNG